MLNSLFIDTSGWASIFIPSETHHILAARYFREAVAANSSLLTSNYIIMELVALLNSPLRIPREMIFDRIDVIRTDPRVTIVQIDDNLDDIAWKLCKSRPEKSWSLVDCTSFVLMQQLGVTNALTTDRHFEQAGLIRLLN